MNGVLGATGDNVPVDEIVPEATNTPFHGPNRTHALTPRSVDLRNGTHTPRNTGTGRDAERRFACALGTDLRSSFRGGRTGDRIRPGFESG